MPYSYLNFDETTLNTGIASGSYFTPDLQELYEQKYLDRERFFGTSDSDIIEFSLYNSSQESIAFNRVVPTVSYSVVQGSYRDINNKLTYYNFAQPFTNYAKFNNDILIDTQDVLRQTQVAPGLYYVLYNFVRNVAGNNQNRLVIKEISPSRTELRLSFAFNTTLTPQNALDAVKVSAFADKKYLFLQISSFINQIVDNNPISETFVRNSVNYNYTAIAQSLGLQNAAELQEFIIQTYVGFDKVITLSANDESIQQASKFIGIDDQIKNFTYTYNSTEFSADEILLAFKTIVTKVSQDRILQKTSINQIQLQGILDLFVKIIYTDWLETQTTLLLTEYANKYFGLYKNSLNFDNGNLVQILTHTNYFNPIDGRVNVQVKLSDPLPLEYDIRTTCWISNISIAPIYFKVNLFAEAVKRNVSLNGVNFTVNVDTADPINQKYSDHDVNTLFAAQSRLKQRINDLLIDYDNFANFIVYSSAELRTKIAKNKISDYNKLETQKAQVHTAASSSALTIRATYETDIDRITQSQIDILNSLDEYESYLFFNTSSIDDKIEDGISYDQNNVDSLLNQLPEYIREDSQSVDYLKFTSMVGHFFDNILVYIKKFPKTYPLGVSELSDYPKNFLDELLNSFSWNTNNFKFQNSGISQYLFDNTEISSSLSSSYFDYGKKILNRFANNLPYIYKTKGTSTSLDLIRSLFGIPSELIQLREYGSTDVNVNRQNYYDFEDIIYLTRIKDGRYIKFDYTDPEYVSVVGDPLYYSGSQANTFTSSRSQTEEFRGYDTFEASFRFKSKDYNFNDKIPIVRKIRNNKIDWEVYIRKTQQAESGVLIYDLHPPESNATSSIKLDELPYLNGNIFTFMISRDIKADYEYDSITPEQNTDTNTYGSITVFTSSLTSSAAEKYVPNTYTFAVNQYDGSLKNFSSIKTKVINYNQNNYFSSGSYYVGNYNTTYNNNIEFDGNIDKIKVFRDPLSLSDFDEHSYNLDSISIPDKAALYYNLIYLWSFDTPMQLWAASSSVNTPLDSVVSASLVISSTQVGIPNRNTYYDTWFTASNFTGESVTQPYPSCAPAYVSEFPYQFDKVVVNQAINSNRFGPNYKNNVKINKIDEFATSNLVPYDYSTKTNDIVGSDSNVVGFYISPYTYLESKMENFLGKEGITDIIGDPKYLTSQNYPELDLRLREFASLPSSSIKYIYPQEFYTTYKLYIDFSIFDYVKNVVPNRASIKTGLLIEPSILERKKFNYKDISYNVSGLYTSSIYFNNAAELTPIFTTGSPMNITVESITTYDTDRNQYNYQRLEIPPSIDSRDFIYAKYGKYINVDSNGYHVRNTYNVPDNEYYQMVNDNGNIVTFTSSFNTVEVIGSGSVTGSSVFTNVYRGEGNTGYSPRHLSKIMMPGSRQKYIAVSGSNFSLNNGVKVFAPAQLTYYTYIKGKNDSTTTVNRKGLPNGSSPVTTIPGYLSLNISSSDFPVYGTTTGSTGDPNNLFVQLPLTASMETSASLDKYIMNL